jgi:hypothetical protein
MRWRSKSVDIRDGNWRRCFAWSPVETVDGWTIWLGFCYRRWVEDTRELPLELRDESDSGWEYHSQPYEHDGRGCYG